MGMWGTNMLLLMPAGIIVRFEKEQVEQTHSTLCQCGNVVTLEADMLPKVEISGARITAHF